MTGAPHSSDVLIKRLNETIDPRYKIKCLNIF